MQREAAGAGVTDIDGWATRILAAASAKKFDTASDVVWLARLVALGERTSRPTSEPPQLSELQAMAVELAARAPDARLAEVPQASAAGEVTETSPVWAAAQPVLAGTDLARDDRLTSAALKLLDAARRSLAREAGLPTRSISRQTAALQVAVDYWTGRVDREPGAFDRARTAQTALTEAMRPLREQAAAKEAAERLDTQYRATIASVRQLRPDFDETAIGATRVGEVTLAQLGSSMSAHDFASLKLDIANRYLAQYQSRQSPASTPTPTPVEAFLGGLTPELRKSWNLQLVGGPALQEIVAGVARSGAVLTAENVEQAVRRAQPALKPPSLPEESAKVANDRFYEIRFDTQDDFEAKLNGALRHRWNQPLQIRSADGSRRVDVYRHGSERGGTTIIDQRDGSAVPQPTTLAVAVSGALGIEGTTHGAVVVSYGSSDAVMANEVRPYQSAAEVLRKGIEDPASRLILSRLGNPAQKLEKLQGDYATFVRSLDVRRAQGLAPDGEGLERLKNYAARLRDSAPGVVGDEAAAIAEASSILAAIDRSLRNTRMGEVSSQLANGGRGLVESGLTTIESGLATIRQIIRRYGIPENHRGPRSEAGLLRAAIMSWRVFSWKVERRLSTGFKSLDELSQARRLKVFTSPWTLLEWFYGNRADWNKWLEGL